MPHPSESALPRVSAAALITPRQYLRLAFLTSIVIGVLSLPGMMRRPGVTALTVAVQFVVVVVFTDALMALNYFLRYSSTLMQRWLRRQPPLRNRLIRVGLNLAVASVLGPLLTRYLSYDPQPRPLVFLVVSSWVFAVVILIVQFFIELNERSRALALENELLRREQLQARYEGLKQQLSPHFLFNSLSTLRWLIHDQPEAAERFVEEMSVVYRYLLQYGEQDAVTLNDELGFLRSYVYLLQMRFGESLQLEIDLPERVLPRLVPPLALQTLVENAVKHNAVSRRQPLRIWVGLGPAEPDAPECLQVRNSRQARLTPEPSSGVGLRNLANRVRVLHQQQQLLLRVDESNGHFSVLVPLKAVGADGGGGGGRPAQPAELTPAAPPRTSGPAPNLV